MKHGFVRIAVGTPCVTVADCAKNLAEIKSLVSQADAAMADVLVLPELAVTGATCGDLFLQPSLLNAAESALEELVEYTKGLRPLVIAGLPMGIGERVYNVAAVLSCGKTLGIVPKYYLSPSERRHFSSAASLWAVGLATSIDIDDKSVPFDMDMLFICDELPALKIGVEFGADAAMPLAMSAELSLAGAAVILSPSAEIEIAGASNVRRTRIAALSKEQSTVYATANAGAGESTANGVFAGHNVVAEMGQILLETEAYTTTSKLSYTDVDTERLRYERNCKQEKRSTPPRKVVDCQEIPFSLPPIDRPLKRHISPTPFLPESKSERHQHCGEMFDIAVAGLAHRIEAAGAKRALIGVSGGLDSALALLVAVRAFDKLEREFKDVIGISMPGFGTTGRTKDNAAALMEQLGITAREIPIHDAATQHFKDIEHDPNVWDETYENAQARERTQILFDLANHENGLVIGTGDLSESALGWCTYNGDHMSHYAPIAGIPKTVIPHILQWAIDTGLVSDAAAVILRDIIDTPISPELLPPDESGVQQQKTEDIVGPYALHDFFLYHMIAGGAPPEKIVYLAEHAFAGQFDRQTIEKWQAVFYKRFHAQQFKRNCTPDSPQVTAVSLSPRGGWIMPSDLQA